VSSSERLSSGNSSERAGQVRQVLEECIRRRSSGEALSDEQIVASHTELMPELGLELRKLRLVERARRQAAEPVSEAGSSGTGGAAGPLPDRFEGYEIQREIHHGGQGAVYQAIQLSTKRKVAIKVLHGGPFIDARTRARLEREIQILGRLDHPNVVRIHDSGEVAGCPYYVMDYISGESLDAYLRDNPLSVNDALRLFVKVCEAVNAAHLRGVIHRDLKPANIRVDANGEPHILDFGLAKVALDTVVENGGPQLLSLTGQFVGSLPWASPEQAAGQAAKIDLRTDVYALGIVLYHMLTGRFPYQVFGNPRDVLDNILRAEPVRPRSLRREIDDEVETIVLKCLEKQRERRYQSAGELARDVRHYLAGEPIEAKRASTLYLLRKSVRRYRAALAVGSAFCVLAVGVAVTTTLLYQKAEHEARKVERVADFLDQIFGAVDPEVARGRDVTFLREALDQATARVGELGDVPEAEGRVRNTIGNTYLQLGLYAAAEEQLRAALDIRRRLFGQQHPATAQTLNLLAGALKERQQFVEAEQCYREALAIRRELFGEQSLEAAETLNDLGQLFYAQGRFAEAEPLLREALDLRQRLGAEPADVASSLANVGSLLRDRGQLTEAEPLLRQALALRERRFGQKHPHTLVSLNKLGLLLRDKREYAAAREVFERTLELRRELLGSEHPHVGVSLNNLGLVLYAQGDYEQAADVFEEALAVYRRTLDPGDARIVETLVNLGAALRQRGELEAALVRCQEALEVVSADDPGYSNLLYLIGRLYLDRGDPQSAEPMLRESFRIHCGRSDANPRAMLTVEGALTDCLIGLKRFEEAERLLLERYALQAEKPGPEDPRTRATLERLAALYEAWDKPAEAEKYRARLPSGPETATAPAP
jgi:tetratricopeptide (TPR) repeat protein